jgi:hypothetical protein
MFGVKVEQGMLGKGRMGERGVKSYLFLVVQTLVVVFQYRLAF